MMRLTRPGFLDGALAKKKDTAHRIANHVATVYGLAALALPFHPLARSTLGQPLPHRPEDIAGQKQEGEEL